MLYYTSHPAASLWQYPYVHNTLSSSFSESDLPSEMRCLFRGCETRGEQGISLYPVKKQSAGLVYAASGRSDLDDSEFVDTSFSKFK